MPRVIAACSAQPTVNQPLRPLVTWPDTVRLRLAERPERHYQEDDERAVDPVSEGVRLRIGVLEPGEGSGKHRQAELMASSCPARTTMLRRQLGAQLSTPHNICSDQRTASERARCWLCIPADCDVRKHPASVVCVTGARSAYRTLVAPST